MDRLEVWTDQDHWRWAYRDGNGIELRSNQLYEHRSDAEQAAQLAYPDLRLDAPEREGRAGDRRILIAIVVLILVVIGLGIVASHVRREEEEE